MTHDGGAANDGHGRYALELRAMIGRPLRAQGAERQVLTATLVQRDGWSDRAAQFVPRDGIAKDRQAAAEAWKRDALLEHASAAEFSRLSLSLLALGAPAELVRRAHEAALDEIRHAHVAFSIASALGGQSFGPGPLPVAQAKVDVDFVALAEASLFDGCVGETIASLHAHTAADHCDIPAIRDALRAIAADEASHASLAYAIVQWAFDTAPPDQRATIATLVTELRERLVVELEARANQAEEPAETKAAWGQLTDRHASIVWQAGVEDVVLPLLDAVVDAQSVNP
ncbi:MAG: ferritin-like domain-containing protein [Polyangiaceae bacterium]|nr:ferritin-like domain-containing protein [Polyangiaceae bacterium]